MYEVIGSFASRAQRVIWALEEMGCDYTHINASPASEKARAFSPHGKVPILRVEGETLVDSAAILAFLADREGKLTYVAGSIARAKQDAHLHFALDDIDAPLWMLFRTRRYAKNSDGLQSAVDIILENAFARLAESIEGPYLQGADFTIADIYTAHALAWARSLKYAFPEAVLAYYKACYGREAPQKMRKKYL